MSSREKTSGRGARENFPAHRVMLTALLLLTVSQAARADEIEQLAPWVVAESRLRPSTDPVRASAILPREEWAGRAIATLPDAFRRIPGAILQESFGGFEPPRISIRGSGLQSAPSSRGVKLLLNQLPLGLADGSFNSALLDPLLSDHLEVQRGLDGWRAAPAVAGGALDFRRTLPAANAAALRLEAGSFGAMRGHATGGLARGAARASGSLSWAEQDGYREHSAQARQAVLGRFERRLTEDTLAAVEFYDARVRYEVPGGLTLAAARATPRSVSADVQRDRPARVADVARVAGSLRHANAEWDFEAGAAFAETNDDFRQLAANGVTRSRSDDAHVRASAARRFTTGRTPHQFRATATAERGWRDQQRYVNAAGQTGARFAHDALEPTTTVMQCEDTFGFAKNFAGSVGVARVDARRAIRDREDATKASRTVSSSAPLPAASLRWHFAPESAVFASVSATAEAPTFDDLLVTAGSGPTLTRRTQPLALQRALTWEMGARGRAGALAWDAAIYRAAWRNEILRLADLRGNPLGAVNASPTTHQGIETSARWLVWKQPIRVTLATTAGWARFVLDHDPVNGSDRLAGVAPHYGSAELVLDRPRGSFVGLGVDWTAGRTPVDHAGKLGYGGQACPRLRAGWRPAPYWTCFVEVRNVFDRRLIASTAGVLDLARNPAATAIFLPAAGRSFTVGIEGSR